MSKVHSLMETAAMAGNLYSWRVDAILIGVVMTALSAGVARLLEIF